MIDEFRRYRKLHWLKPLLKEAASSRWHPDFNAEG
jgi:hypothetical protein